MGACNFLNECVSKNYKDAYASLVEDALYEYGHDPYNGTISTCYLSRRAPKVIQKTYGPRAEKAALKLIESEDWGEKREARVLDLGAVKGKRGAHMWWFYGWAAC